MRNSKYTREFRDSSVQLVINSDESTAKIAKDLDVNEKTLYNWVREYKKANNIPIFPRGYSASEDGKKNIKETAEEENKRLRAENKLLKQERDILKKATAYFAKEVL
ncbi:transposase [Sulfurimonas autotrophica]|uniref:Transposase IS3/IS911 family protein n=1 Tax=Sulfurimonas autotrophica (strain ATCC BAA-671 / DSM 16294 / JCM 11897 / OK10) TaxID=563040 RepID=E0US54_SULAO|nr:transposase [Sulfurimonas autotrophica]ADN09077.1 transposase IS3/IS911 family protein [Sulfurimonas autotrophica DSM 16294]